MIEPHKLLNWPFEEKTHTYTKRDTMLYALSLGFGDNPLDPWHLQHVLEDRLRAFPTLALVLAHPGPWTADPRSGVNRYGVVHGEQILTIHRPIPPEASVRSRNRVTAVLDKGSDKGAVIQTEREVYESQSGRLLATLGGTTFCRRDGGFDSTGKMVYGKAREEVIDQPERPPDSSVEISTGTQAALLYRLNGDYNPLHSDPESARASGFERPISHGLLTFGMTARLLEYAFGQSQLTTIRARFAAPMYPGETLKVNMWRGLNGQVWFDAFVADRNVRVLSKGFATLGQSHEIDERGEVK